MVAYWAKPEAPRVNVPQRVVQSTVPVEHDAQTQPAAVVAKVLRPPRAPEAQPSVAKAAVFPTPSPLTAEERALMQLAASNPAVLQNVHISQQRRNQPLTVEPIEIRPLENSDSLED